MCCSPAHLTQLHCGATVLPQFQLWSPCHRDLVISCRVTQPQGLETQASGQDLAFRWGALAGKTLGGRASTGPATEGFGKSAWGCWSPGWSQVNTSLGVLAFKGKISFLRSTPLPSCCPYCQRFPPSAPGTYVNLILQRYGAGEGHLGGKSHRTEQAVGIGMSHSTKASIMPLFSCFSDFIEQLTWNLPSNCNTSVVSDILVSSLLKEKYATY